MARKRSTDSVSKEPPKQKAPSTIPEPSAAIPPLPAGERASKKDQILLLYQAGITEVADLAAITQARTTYVASVLRDAGELSTYFDLYTSTSEPMNIYSKYFVDHLGFKDEETARASVAHIQTLYAHFGQAGDRAGQHHALLMALTMFDRARWTGKQAEAAIYRDWLHAKLDETA